MSDIEDNLRILWRQAIEIVQAPEEDEERLRGEIHRLCKQQRHIAELTPDSTKGFKDQIDNIAARARALHDAVNALPEPEQAVLFPIDDISEGLRDTGQSRFRRAMIALESRAKELAALYGPVRNKDEVKRHFINECYRIFERYHSKNPAIRTKNQFGEFVGKIDEFLNPEVRVGREFRRIVAEVWGKETKAQGT